MYRRTRFNEPSSRNLLINRLRFSSRTPAAAFTRSLCHRTVTQAIDFSCSNSINRAVLTSRIHLAYASSHMRRADKVCCQSIDLSYLARKQCAPRTSCAREYIHLKRLIEFFLQCNDKIRNGDRKINLVLFSNLSNIYIC